MAECLGVHISALHRSWYSSPTFVRALLRYAIHFKSNMPYTNWLGLPDPAIQRSLKLVAKVVQSMANLNTVRILGARTSMEA
jgi:hypothetical protein